jgi:hypothetical protein
MKEPIARIQAKVGLQSAAPLPTSEIFLAEGGLLVLHRAMTFLGPLCHRVLAAAAIPVSADEPFELTLAHILRFYHQILRQMGPETLRRISLGLGEAVVWPQPPANLADAIRQLDYLTYEFHQAKVPDRIPLHLLPELYVRAERTLGHYHVLLAQDQRVIVALDLPYPDDFHHGTLLGVARQFHPSARIQRLPGTYLGMGGTVTRRFEIRWDVAQA